MRNPHILLKPNPNANPLTPTNPWDSKDVGFDASMGVKINT